MLSFEEAIHLHTCISFIENHDMTSKMDKIECEGIEINFYLDDEGYKKIFSIKVNDKFSPTLEKLVQDYLDECINI